MKDETSDKGKEPLSRRKFLAGATAAAGGIVSSKGAGQESPPRRENAGRPAGRKPDHPRPTRLTEARWDRAVLGQRLHPSLVREMIAESVMHLTEEGTLEDAWRAIFKPDDIIGIKANQSGARVIGTGDDMVEALVDLLGHAGFGPERIVLIEGPERLARDLKTTPARRGWGETIVDFGSGTDQLAAVLDQVTAILNVPFIKSHNIAGMTCGLKNLSHALVKHPARYHANGCAPYIADIVAVPAIRDKLRLTVVNGFRVVFDGGPQAVEEKIAATGTMLMGTDPVAADTLALDMLDGIREGKGLKPIGKGGPFLDYLDRAAQLALGTNDLDLMDVRKIRHDT